MSVVAMIQHKEQLISRLVNMCIDHLWFRMGVQMAGNEAGPHAQISQWTVIHKGNTGPRCAYTQLYKFHEFLAPVIFGFCTQVHF